MRSTLRSQDTQLSTILAASHEKIEVMASSLEDDDNIKPVDDKVLKKSADKKDKEGNDDDETIRDVEHERLRLQAPVGLQSVTKFPQWLRINLLLGNITVGLMFVVALLNLAFAGVMRDDLKDE